MKYRSVVLDTNVIIRAFKNPKILYDIIEAAGASDMEVVVSESILAELEEHLDKAIRLSFDRFEEAFKSSSYSIGIRDAFEKAVLETVRLVLTLRKLRTEPITSRDLLEVARSCGELLEEVKARDPDDVHVIAVAIKVRPSILLTFDERAFGGAIRESSRECDVEVMNPYEFLRRFGKGAE